MGRPKGTEKKHDLKQVRVLAELGCTHDEIARLLGICRKTVERRADIKEAIEDGQAEMKKSLRRMQFQKAREGNVAMLIWLGKQLLGQRERIDQEIREETVIIEPIPKSGTDA